MEIILIVAAILMLCLLWMCAKKSNELAGFYKAVGICGRWYAVFTGACIFGGIFTIIIGIVAGAGMLIGAGAGKTKLPEVSGESMAGIIGTVIALVIVLAIGIFMYKRLLKKCPGELRKRLLRDIMVIGIGTGVRVSLIFMIFIIKTWLEMSKPIEYTVDGKRVWRRPGCNELYDSSGYYVGQYNPDTGKARMIKRK